MILNFGILIYFKYAGFFVAEFAELFHFKNAFTFSKIILPVGVSFYTFQSLSYVIDVYRGKLKASDNFINTAAFVSFFPQLVAGPIERAPNLLLQIQKPRTFNEADAKEGLRYILWGLFKKMMVADNCAPIVEDIFDKHNDLSSPMLWYGAILFAVQIYCDFSAYSEIAIGSGKLLGIQFMQNFHFPYFATNIKEFWKRWHISLTTWFKDYIFIPLGGSRFTSIKTYRNVFIVFVLSGLWHGANYTFIAWGMYHAILYVLYISFFEKLAAYITRAFGLIITFVLVLIGWVFFRSENLTSAFSYIGEMFRWNNKIDISIDLKSLIGIFILIVVETYNRSKQFGLDLAHWQSQSLRWMAYTCLVIIVLAYGNFNEQKFIYFNF